MITAWLLVGVLAVPQFGKTGKELLEACTANRKATADKGAMELILTSECYAYLAGVSDALNASQQVCSSEATLGQNVVVVLKYLRDHPDRLHEHRYFLTRDALTLAFSCKAKKNP
jgi:hypothetical protein